ncbi:MAG: HNH endonuclease [Planctomycetes bacterium]|nr:HNH endonuclease [Planctomycetota bacterium]
MDELWDQVWAELRCELSHQPRCIEHPEFPCIGTLGQGAVNDILQVDQDGIRVRSHRTNNEDVITPSSFRAWWVHLQKFGTATLDPNDPNCPRSDRAVLVGAIFAVCLRNRIEHEGRHIRLRAVPELLDWALPEELPVGAPLIEGASRTVLINAYERDPKARSQCIAAHGTTCCVCGFSFGPMYGPVADGYIHLHHLVPLHEVGAAHIVDPVRDLRPVCPNCHAVLHRRVPAFSIEEMRELIRRQRQV